jgi:nitrate/TMAO reductase-like tetraheme cytochrome c subunit
MAVLYRRQSCLGVVKPAAKTMRRPLSLEFIRDVAAACAVLGVTSIAMPSAHAAAAATPDPNEICFACHADKDANGAGGKSIAVDGSTFAKSVHGELKLECTACHADVSVKQLPHAEKLNPVACGNCHDKQVKEYAGTAHGVAIKGGSTVAATCVDCHGKHDILRSKDPASRTSHAGLEATCGKCHANEAMVLKAKLPGGNVGAQFHDSIHGRALAGAARGSAPTCTNCHGAHSIHQKSDPLSSTHRARIPDTCGACHTKEKQQFAQGQHGKLRQNGNLGAPGCTDCHGAHRIQAHDLPLFQTEVIKECGNCHADYLKTYRDTFHGQVTALGYSRMATCASCHGSHEILPASNPASMVSPQNRLKTCQTCHAGATQNFANYDPHANRHNRARSPLYYYAGLFMEWLLIGVFSFFAVHTLLWFYRSMRVRLERRTQPGDRGEGR